MVIWILLLLTTLVFAWWLLSWGMIFLRATGALLYLSGGMNPFLRCLYYRIEVHTEHYPHGKDGLLPYRVYRPLTRSVAPALVIYHGATPHGEEHPDLDNLARALAHIGLIVFIPRLPRLKAVIIDESNLDSITTFYRYIQGHERICPGYISVTGTSFAGGMLLKALLEEDMHMPSPRAVFLYGTYCDLETTLRFILTGSVVEEGVEVTVEPDRWGQVIFFYNYLEHITQSFNRETMQEVLGYYITDRIAEGDEARARLSINERRIADLILTPSNPESNALAEEVLQHARPLIGKLSPSRFYSRIHFPFWVLHGRSDTMVPYTEALALKRLMPSQVRLYVSTRYGHKKPGHESSLWRSLRDMVGLVVYLGRFLYAVKE
ncbi:MAG: hypothetical protein JSU77_04845 [Fidelibacterota bacterium]|nr:MAG: hypothetical protein JSU77_04845 [Candidatus Neomarinimicrobiota bacterium]